MKIIKYKILTRINRGTEENPVWDEILNDKQIGCSEDKLAACEEIAKSEAYRGAYAIKDDGTADLSAIPSQLDRIEAQVAYTAMMTDTLLEV